MNDYSDRCKKRRQDKYAADIISQEIDLNDFGSATIDFQNGNHGYWPRSGWIIDPEGKQGGPWKNQNFKIICGKIDFISEKLFQGYYFANAK